MVTYATYEDLIEVIPERDIEEITDEENAGAPKTSRVDRVRERAYNLINSYVSGRYTIPFPSVPPLLRDIEVDLVTYYFYFRPTDDKVPDTIRDSYNNAITTLKRIAAGDVVIEGATPATVTSTQLVPKINKKHCDRVFTSELLRKMP